MTGNLTLTAAFLLGLFASGHCILMCGGISGALMLASSGGDRGRPPFGLLLAMQLGRVSSYMLAAALLAGAGASIVAFVGEDSVRLTLRIISAITFTAIGLTLLGYSRRWDLGVGRAMWPRLAPLARKLVPVRHFPQALALGAIWGWMPCGFVYSVLLLAWLSMDSVRGALTMLLFGLGTMPALLASAYGAAGAMRIFGRPGARSTMGMALLLMAVLTLSGPWLVAHSGVHMARWLPLDCITP